MTWFFNKFIYKSKNCEIESRPKISEEIVENQISSIGWHVIQRVTEQRLPCAAGVYFVRFVTLRPTTFIYKVYRDKQLIVPDFVTQNTFLSNLSPEKLPFRWSSTQLISMHRFYTTQRTHFMFYTRPKTVRKHVK